MVLRVDVVHAALAAVYGDLGRRRIVALTPQGRQLDQELVEELAGEEELTLLSARFEGFDERIVEHMATDSVSIGPYVLSGGELPAMVLVDAVARRRSDPGERRGGDVFRGARGRSRVPAVHAAARVQRLACAGRPSLRRPRAHRDVAQGAKQRAKAFVRGPIDRLTTGLPAPWPTVIDWVVTIVVAVGAVLAIKAWIVNPYRIPSSSMEPTLHCAEPQPGCLASYSDRVLANRFIYHFRDPHRGDIVVFNTPAKALEACGAGGTFVKRIIGLPGDTVEERNGTVLINGEAGRALRSRERARQEDRQLEGSGGELLHDGRQPLAVLRQPRVGLGPATTSSGRFSRSTGLPSAFRFADDLGGRLRRAEPGSAGLTTLAAGSGARSTSPYRMYCLDAARWAPLPAPPRVASFASIVRRSPARPPFP